LTCAIGTVWVDLSSPANVISDGEVAVTVPVSVVPSRIRTVARCPEPVLFVQPTKSKSTPSVALAKMLRHV